MLLYAFLFCLISFSVDARRSDYVAEIQPHAQTSWGSWRCEEFCSDGSYAYGFSLKVEKQQGTGDDTAVNGVKLLCRFPCGTHSHSVTSRVMDWGEWESAQYCPDSYFLKSVAMSSEKVQGGGDDTAVNNFSFVCQSAIHPTKIKKLSGKGMPWGTWSSPVSCPAGSYICGIKTKVEDRQGKGDDTALNGAIFTCCTM